MIKHTPANLYNYYYVERKHEQQDLFQLLSKRYPITTVLYPGSFVHVTPSFVFSEVDYVDSDQQAKAFFHDPLHYEFVSRHKTYASQPKITFHAADYRQDWNKQHKRFDLLISQFAGFVWQHCKPYLRVGGLLLVNDSHGDASIASLDHDCELVAVITHADGKWRLSETNLESYFVPKSSKQVITTEYITRIQRGAAYKQTADNYIFKRIE
ncbi:MAG: hypothetical protein R3E39_04685 [Anaerolineae bacterium]